MAEARSRREPSTRARRVKTDPPADNGERPPEELTGSQTETNSDDNGHADNSSPRPEYLPGGSADSEVRAEAVPPEPVDPDEVACRFVTEEPAPAEVDQDEPIQREPVQPEPVQTEPIRSEPVRS